MKIISSKEYKYLVDMQQRYEILKNRTQEMQHELDDYKRGADGECVPGEHCFSCASAATTPYVQDGVSQTPTCTRIVPCKHFHPRYNIE